MEWLRLSEAPEQRVHNAITFLGRDYKEPAPAEQKPDGGQPARRPAELNMDRAAKRIVYTASRVDPSNLPELQRGVGIILHLCMNKDVAVRAYNVALRELASSSQTPAAILEALVSIAPSLGIERSSYLVMPLVFYYGERNDPRWLSLHDELLGFGGKLPIAYWRHVAMARALRGDAAGAAEALRRGRAENPHPRGGGFDSSAERSHAHLHAGCHAALLRSGVFPGASLGGLVPCHENFTKFLQASREETAGTADSGRKSGSPKGILVSFLGGYLQDVRLKGIASAKLGAGASLLVSELKALSDELASIAGFIAMQMLTRSRDLVAAEAFAAASVPELEAGAMALDTACLGPDGAPLPPAEAGVKAAATVRIAGGADTRHSHMLAAGALGHLLLSAAYGQAGPSGLRPPGASGGPLELEAQEEQRAAAAFAALSPEQRREMEVRGRRLLMYSACLALKPFPDEWNDLSGRVAQTASYSQFTDSVDFIVQVTSALSARTVPIAQIVTRSLLYYLLAGRYDDAIRLGEEASRFISPSEGRPAFGAVADLTEVARLATSFEDFEAAAERIMARTEQTGELQYNQNYIVLARAAAYARRPKEYGGGESPRTAIVRRVIEHGRQHVANFPSSLAGAAVAISQLAQARGAFQPVERQGEGRAAIDRVRAVLEQVEEERARREGEGEGGAPGARGRPKAEGDRLRDESCLKNLVDDTAFVLASPAPFGLAEPWAAVQVARETVSRGIPLMSNAVNAIVQGLWRIGEYRRAIEVRSEISAAKFPDSKAMDRRVAPNRFPRGEQAPPQAQEPDL